MKNVLKNKKALLAMLLSLITLFTSLAPAFTASAEFKVGSKYEFTKTWLNAYYSNIEYTEADGTKINHNQRDRVALYNLTGSKAESDGVDGTPIYCIQIYNPSDGTGETVYDISSSEYWNNKLTKSAQEGITLASIYGYPNTKEKYSSAADKRNYQLATQVIMWEYSTNKRTSPADTEPTSDFASVFENYSDAKTAYKNILTKMQSHGVKPSFASTSETPTAQEMKYNPKTKKYEITLEDANKVLSQFTVKTNNADVKTSVSGNTLKLTSSKPVTDAATILLTKKGTTTNDGFTLEKAGKQVLFCGTNPSAVYGYVRVNSKDTATVEISKIDENNKSVAGVEFRVTQSTLGYDRVFATDNNGNINISGLIAGYTYTVTEILPTDDTYLDPSYTVGNTTGEALTFTFTADDNTPTTISVMNRKAANGAIALKKIDADTLQMLAGAEYTIYASDKTTVIDVLTTKSTSTVISSLRPGRYYVQETKAPSGYFRDATKYPVTVTSGVVMQFVLDDQSKGTIEISKKDINTGAALEGAIFGIYSDANCKNLVEEAVTDVNGLTQTGRLQMGDYYIKETKAPAGYLADDTVHKVTLETGVFPEQYVTSESQTVLALPEDPNEYIKLPYVVNEPTAEDLASMKQVFVDDSSTNEDITEGEDTTGGEDANENESVVQPENPDLYYIAGTPTSNVIVTYNKAERAFFIEFEGNTYKYIVHEQIAEIQGLEEQTWYSIDEQGNATKVSAQNLANIPNIINGITSEVHSSKYLQELIKTITDNTKIQYELGSVVVTVRDMAGKRLDGVKVAIYHNGVPITGGTYAVTGDGTYGQAGRCTFTNLAVGEEYEIKQLTTNNALTDRKYEISDVTRYVTITRSGSTEYVTFINRAIDDATLATASQQVTFFNEAITTTLHKSDITNSEPVAGAQIVILNEDGSIYKVCETDENGDITLYAIPVGNYTFIETIAPDGYLLSETVYNFTVNPDGTITGDTEITNDPTEVTITKLDSLTGEPVEGATYAFYNEDNELVAEGTTNEVGQVTILKLTAGTYTFVETSAPVGYKVDNEIHSVTLSEDGSVTGDTVVEDTPLTLSITKINNNDEALKGVTFAFYNELGELVAKSTTDEYGIAELSYIAAGTYTYVEVEYLDGYIVDDQEYTVTVLEDGTVEGTTLVTNTLTEVKIQKIDGDTKKPLAGVKIEVYNSENELVNADNCITDENGYIILIGLPSGEYTYKETETLEGYELDKNIYSFTLNEDGTIKGDVTMKNFKIVSNVPKTGTNLNVTLMAVMTTISAFGIVAIATIRRRKNK